MPAKGSSTPRRASTGLLLRSRHRPTWPRRPPHPTMRARTLTPCAQPSGCQARAERKILTVDDDTVHVRVVVHNHGDPPAKRPALLSVTTFGTFSREFSSPSCHCRHLPHIRVTSNSDSDARGCRVEVPVVVSPFRCRPGPQVDIGPPLSVGGAAVSIRDFSLGHVADRDRTTVTRTRAEKCRMS
jgi:hypothetical protein